MMYTCLWLSHLQLHLGCLVVAEDDECMVEELFRMVCDVHTCWYLFCCVS